MYLQCLSLVFICDFVPVVKMLPYILNVQKEGCQKKEDLFDTNYRKFGMTEVYHEQKQVEAEAASQ
jgi:hypothetical protein